MACGLNASTSEYREERHVEAVVRPGRPWGILWIHVCSEQVRKEHETVLRAASCFGVITRTPTGIPLGRLRCVSSMMLLAELPSGNMGTEACVSSTMVGKMEKVAGDDLAN